MRTVFLFCIGGSMKRFYKRAGVSQFSFLRFLSSQNIHQRRARTCLKCISIQKTSPVRSEIVLKFSKKRNQHALLQASCVTRDLSQSKIYLQTNRSNKYSDAYVMLISRFKKTNKTNFQRPHGRCFSINEMHKFHRTALVQWILYELQKTQKKNPEHQPSYKIFSYHQQ